MATGRHEFPDVPFGRRREICANERIDAVTLALTGIMGEANCHCFHTRGAAGPIMVVGEFSDSRMLYGAGSCLCSPNRKRM